MSAVSLRIIGIGSPVAGDGFGIEAIDALRELPELAALGEAVEWQTLERPGVTLLQYLKGAEAVVLIDAMLSGDNPGTVKRLALSDLLQQGSIPSSHQLGVAESLVLARALGELPPQLLIYGIEGGAALLPEQWLPSLQKALFDDLSELSNLNLR